MARAMWKGAIQFGLVTIPVKLYSTGESASGIQLNMLHKKCGSRLKQQYICPTDNEVVGRDAAGALIAHVDRWGRRIYPVAVLANFAFAFLL